METETVCEESVGTCADAVPDVPGTTTKALCGAATTPGSMPGTFTSTATYVLTPTTKALCDAATTTAGMFTSSTTYLGTTEAECEDSGGNYYPPAKGIECQHCVAGMEPIEAQTGCTNCEAGEVSSGDECKECKSGTEPDDTKRRCMECATGRFSESGLKCDECEQPRVVNAQKTTCVACVPGKEPNSQRTMCEFCVYNDYSDVGYSCKACPPKNRVNDATCTARADSGNATMCQLTLDETACEPEAKCDFTIGHTICIDIDECIPNDGAGECDILAEKIGGDCTELDDGDGGVVRECASPCLNEVPGFRCGGCPSGFEGMADKTQNNGEGCTLPVIVGNSTDAAVQLQSQVTLRAPAAVLRPGSPAERKYTEALVKELAAKMGIDPSEIDVKGLIAMPDQDTVTGRRNLQNKHRSLAGDGGVVHVQLNFAITSAEPSQAHAALQSLNAHLADPDAALGAEAAAAANDGVECSECVAHPGQKLAPTFGCPAGKYLQSNICKSCEGSSHTIDGKTCQKCGANEVPNDAGDGCRCAGDGDGPDADFYGQTEASGLSTAALKCYDSRADWSAADFAGEVFGCRPCGDCLRCDDGVATVKVEFMVSEAKKVVNSASIGLVGPLAVFECPLQGSEENPACSGTQANGTLTCGIGYGGALCSVCATEYTKTGGECIDCSGGTGTSIVFLAVCAPFVVFGVCVLVFYYSHRKERTDKKGGAAKVIICGILRDFG
jgi:hypothetical protein